jgi:hypothetical protein
VTRIFATLSVVGNLGLVLVFWLGWKIGDDALSVEVRKQMSTHFLSALAAIPVAMLVHSVAFTYFMGTGRWIEETSEAYRLGPEYRDKNIKLKYKILPGMMLCIGLMLATGAFGAISDPGANMRMANSKLIHFSLAITTLLANLLVTWKEWQEIARNGVLVEAVMDRVRQIRKEKGLDKPANPQPTNA